ncbi:MAG: alanine racemase [Planctomycetota bacterium]|jgi:alanine racemase
MKIFRQQPLIRPDLQAHIYSEALRSNVRNLKSLCPPKTKFCAVVKANAYGHGITEVVNILKNADVDFFAVASIYEAIHIEHMSKKQSILILEPISPNASPDHIFLCSKKGWHCVISSVEAFESVSQLLRRSKNSLNLHVNVETGMGRCGLCPNESIELITKIDRCPNTHLAGVYTHFATADEADLTYAYEQLNLFNDFLSKNDLASREDTIIHAANSAATIKMPGSHFDMVRCGISMYGYYSRQMPEAPVKLAPVMKLQAPVGALKKIPAGHSVSYGRSFTTTRDTTAAIIPLGYADGYWRCFANKAKMLLGSDIVNVIGRVSMDQLLIDVTDIEDVAVGRMVTIIDNRHDSPCGVYALAELADTICYEILICVHAHVNRIIH